MNDAIERDRELFTRIAATQPGLVRTLSVLVDEVERVELDPDVQCQLGDRIRRIGQKMIENAARIVIDDEGDQA